MVDTAHVMRQMELNADSGIKDFFLVEHSNGMVLYYCSLPLEQVVEMLKAKMVHEGTTAVLRWRPTSDLPKLPASLERVMKKPDMLKHVAGEFMIWLLSHQGLQKPGDIGLLGRSYPVLRELFVITGKALSSFKGHVSLEEIVPCSSMKSPHGS